MPVVLTIVLGALILVAFGLWEVYAPLKEPVVPIKLFKNIHWVSACVLLGLGASIYYGEPTHSTGMLANKLTSSSYGHNLAQYGIHSVHGI